MRTRKFNEFIEANKNNIHSDLFFEAQNIMSKINKEFEPYFNIYMKIKNNEISQDEGINNLRELLSQLNGQELGDINELCKMYFEMNCGWQEYQLAQIVHYIVMELFDGYYYTKAIQDELEKY